MDTSHLAWESFVVLAAAVSVIFGVAGVLAHGILSKFANRTGRNVGSRASDSALWQRNIWQMATAGVLAVTVAELSGLGRLLGLAIAQGSALVLPAFSPLHVPAEATAATPPSARIASSSPAGLAPAADSTAMRYAALRTADGDVGIAGLGPALEIPPAKAEGSEASRAGAGRSEPQAGPSPAAPHQAALAIAAPSSLRTLPAAAIPQASAMALLPLTTAKGLSTIALVGLVAWFLGALAVGVVHAAALLRRRAALRRCPVIVDETLHAALRDLAERMGLGRPIRVLECDAITSPAACGLRRPTLLLPPHFVSAPRSSAVEGQAGPCAAIRLAPRKEAILAHEVAHLAAGDSLWMGLSLAACAALWWHPLAWRLRRELRAASELAADEASLLVPGGPLALADGLVDMGRKLLRRQHLAWLSAEGTGVRSALGRRVERLLRLPEDAPPPDRRRMARRRWILPVALVLLASCCTAWARTQVPTPAGETTMNVVANAWRGSLAATALWAFITPGDAISADAHRAPEQPSRLQASAWTPGAGFELAMATDDNPPPPRDGDRGPPRRGRGPAWGPGFGPGGPPPEGFGPDGPGGPPPEDLGPDGPGFDGPGPGPAGPPPREMPDEVRKLVEKARELRKQLREMPDSNQEDRREIEEQLAQVMAELREMGPPPAGPGGRGEAGGPGGRGGQRGFGRGRGGPEMPPPPNFDGPNGPDLKKFFFMQIAADSLKKAGMDDQAKELMDTVDKLKKELEEKGVQVPPPPPPMDGPPPQGPGAPEGAAGPDGRSGPGPGGPESRGPGERGWNRGGWGRGGDRGPDTRGPEGAAPETRGPGPRGADARGPEFNTDGQRGPRDHQLRGEVEELRKEIRELRDLIKQQSAKDKKE